MKAALYIMHAYRRYKLRSYITLLSQKFHNAKNMRDYGKSIKWPAPPLPLRKTIGALRNIYRRWHAYMILRKIPRNEWPQMKLKVTTASSLRGQRPYWGQSRKWEGNYLSMSVENTSCGLFNESVNNLKNIEHFSKVLFSSFVTKFNRFNKVAERVILVTDKSIYKLCSLKFKNLKEVIELNSVTGVSVSPGQDQLIVIHCGGNDFVISLHSEKKQDRVGELIGVLANRFYE